MPSRKASSSLSSTTDTNSATFTFSILSCSLVSTDQVLDYAPRGDDVDLPNMLLTITDVVHNPRTVAKFKMLASSEMCILAHQGSVLHRIPTGQLANRRGARPASLGGAFKNNKIWLSYPDQDRVANLCISFEQSTKCAELAKMLEATLCPCPERPSSSGRVSRGALRSSQGNANDVSPGRPDSPSNPRDSFGSVRPHKALTATMLEDQTRSPLGHPFGSRPSTMFNHQTQESVVDPERPRSFGDQHASLRHASLGQPSKYFESPVATQLRRTEELLNMRSWTAPHGSPSGPSQRSRPLSPLAPRSASQNDSVLRAPPLPRPSVISSFPIASSQRVMADSSFARPETRAGSRLLDSQPENVPRDSAFEALAEHRPSSSSQPSHSRISPFLERPPTRARTSPSGASFALSLDVAVELQKVREFYQRSEEAKTEMLRSLRREIDECVELELLQGHLRSVV